MAEKMTASEAQALFPGFIVKDGDFEKAGQDYVRVNYNGYRYNLKNWQFDNATGEFCRIVSRERGNVVLLDRTPRPKRVAEWFRLRRVMKWAYIVLSILGIVTVGGWILAPDGDFAVAMLIAFCCLGAITLGGAVDFWWAKRKLGPHPLEKKQGEDFGPQAATSPVDHPAGNDLAY